MPQPKIEILAVYKLEFTDEQIDVYKRQGYRSITTGRLAARQGIVQATALRSGAAGRNRALAAGLSLIHI